MKHLAKYLHDVTLRVTEIWCDSTQDVREATEHFDDVTCSDCLLKAIEFGDEARARLRTLMAPPA